jgi:asparagine synthase (glutamine-hydrolysing)
MAHSVEARVPFLDYRLVEFTTQLQVDYLDGRNESKKIMIHSFKDILPEKILNRKDKKGFITPEERWLKQDLVLNSEKN